MMDGISRHKRVENTEAYDLMEEATPISLTQDYVESDGTDALKPNPGVELNFMVPNNPFAFSPGQLNKMLNPKSLAAFRALGGLKGLQKGLRTSLESGLRVDEATMMNPFGEAGKMVPRGLDKRHTPNADQEHIYNNPTTRSDSNFEDRMRLYSDNRLPEKRSKSVWRLLWNAYNDRVLILLTIAAIVSLALGLYTASRTAEEPLDYLKGDCIEPLLIIFAILIVVTIGALTDHQKEKSFRHLERKVAERSVRVTRGGIVQDCLGCDILVGDLLSLEPGDLVPADGILFTGHAVQLVEPSITRSDRNLAKMPLEAHEYRQSSPHTIMDPLIVSGSQLFRGVGTMLVTSVGNHSTRGRATLSSNTAEDISRTESMTDSVTSVLAQVLLVRIFTEYLRLLSHVRCLFQLCSEAVSHHAPRVTMRHHVLLAIALLSTSICPTGKELFQFSNFVIIALLVRVLSYTLYETRTETECMLGKSLNILAAYHTRIEVSYAILFGGIVGGIFHATALLIWIAVVDGICLYISIQSKSKICDVSQTKRLSYGRFFNKKSWTCKRRYLWKHRANIVHNEESANLVRSHKVSAVNRGLINTFATRFTLTCGQLYGAILLILPSSVGAMPPPSQDIPPSASETAAIFRQIFVHLLKMSIGALAAMGIFTTFYVIVARGGRKLATEAERKLNRTICYSIASLLAAGVTMHMLKDDPSQIQDAEVTITLSGVLAFWLVSHIFFWWEQFELHNDLASWHCLMPWLIGTVGTLLCLLSASGEVPARSACMFWPPILGWPYFARLSNRFGSFWRHLRSFRGREDRNELYV